MKIKSLIPPDFSKPVFDIFPEQADRIIENKCVTCDNEIHDGDFKDEMSIKEYGISGMCQECQDSVFNSEPGY